MNRVQLLVTRGEGVAVQNAQVSVFKELGESKTGRRQVANQSEGFEVYGTRKLPRLSRPQSPSVNVGATKEEQTSQRCSPRDDPVRRPAHSPPPVIPA